MFFNFRTLHSVLFGQNLHWFVCLVICVPTRRRARSKKIRSSIIICALMSWWTVSANITVPQKLSQVSLWQTIRQPRQGQKLVGAISLERIERLERDFQRRVESTNCRFRSVRLKCVTSLFGLPWRPIVKNYKMSHKMSCQALIFACVTLKPGSMMLYMHVHIFMNSTNFVCAWFPWKPVKCGIFLSEWLPLPWKLSELSEWHIN